MEDQGPGERGKAASAISNEISRLHRDYYGRGARHSLYREVNERIAELTAASPGLEKRFVCECGGRGCIDLVELSGDEYAELRRHPNRFVVLSGHENGVRTVAAGAGFSVIEVTS